MLTARTALVVSVAWIGCGRIGFDPLTSGDGSPDSPPSPDAFVVVGPCPYGPTAPDPLRISGTTENAANSNAVANVAVEASLTVGGPVIAQTTSDSSGNYNLDIPTGGHPISPVLSLRSANFMDGTWVFDAPIVASIPGFYSPMGQPGDVDTLYSAGGGGTRDPAKGTIYFEVMDCAGARVNGVTISVSPAASRIAYAGPAGIPSTIYSTTTSSGRAWAFNVPAGTVTLSASKSGATFLSHTMTVLPGNNFMGTRLRPMP